MGSMDRRVLEEGGGRPIALVPGFGHKVLTDAGFPALYVPHAIDTGVWKP